MAGRMAGTRIPNIGTVVRCRHPEHTKNMCRAVVAIVQDEKSVCLLLEDLIPKPIQQAQAQTQTQARDKKGGESSNKSTRFLISPTVQRTSQDEDVEITVELNEIQELLPFEQQDHHVTSNGDDDKGCISTWKDRGDQLLTLGDAISAIPYYEMALSLTTHVDIGGTIILPIKGFPTIAEIDCVEGDSLDITIVESGEESTISKSQISLGILENDKEKIQERILLNLARCMMQLADMDSVNRPKYFKAAVLACSLVLTIATYHEKENDDNDDEEAISKNSQTALYIRCKAQSSLSKWPQAIADAKKLVKLGNEQGNKMLATIERLKKGQEKQNKKLAKAVSQWVHTATSESVSGQNEAEPTDEPPTDKNTTSNQTDRIVGRDHQLLTAPNLSVILVFLAAFLIRIFLQKYE